MVLVFHFRNVPRCFRIERGGERGGGGPRTNNKELVRSVRVRDTETRPTSNQKKTVTNTERLSYTLHSKII